MDSFVSALSTGLHLADSVDQFADLLVEMRILLSFLCNFIAGVHDGGVVLAAEVFADFCRRGFRHRAAEIHCDLSGKCDVLASLFGKKVFRRDVEIGSGDVLDQL